MGPSTVAEPYTVSQPSVQGVRSAEFLRDLEGSTAENTKYFRVPRVSTADSTHYITYPGYQLGTKKLLIVFRQGICRGKNNHERHNVTRSTLYYN